MINQIMIKKLIDLVMKSDWTVDYKLKVIEDIKTEWLQGIGGSND